MENVYSFLKNIGVGSRPMNDPFLKNTYECCKVFQRLGVTNEDDEELCHEVMREFTCNACQSTFLNLLDYELHYHNTHHFVCTECKKWRPSSRLLEIHIQEAHDSFFKVLAQKQPMYQCFVCECDKKFNNASERRDHCIEVHAYPKNYRFYSNDESTKSKDSTENSMSMDIDENKQSQKKEVKIHLENSKQKTFIRKQKFNLQPTTTPHITDDNIGTKLKPVTMFIPRQVQQKSYTKKLTRDKKMETDVLESGSMKELAETLPKT